MEMRIKRNYEKQKFQIQSKIQQKDDEIALLSELNQEYQKKIIELKEKSQKLSNDISFIKIKNFDKFNSQNTLNQTKIAQVKAKFNNEIIDLQNSFREEQNKIQDEYQKKLEELNQDRENRISLVLSQLHKQVSLVQGSVAAISSKFREAQTLASIPISAFSNDNQNINDDYLLSIKESLQQQLNQKQEERKKRLIVLKSQLQECVETLENEQEEYQSELKNGQKRLIEMNEKYEKELTKINQIRNNQISLYNERLQQAKAELSKQNRKINKLFSKFDREMDMKKQELYDIKARSLPVTHQEIIIIRDNHFNEDIQNARETLQKMKRHINKKDERLRAARNRNSYLKQEIARIDHYIRFYLASPLQTTIPVLQVY